jgi:hypothetical protein
MIGWQYNPGPPPEWDDPEPPEVDLMPTDDLWALVDLLEPEGLGDDALCLEARAELEQRGEE